MISSIITCTVADPEKSGEGDCFQKLAQKLTYHLPGELRLT